MHVEQKEFKSKTQEELFLAAFTLFSRYGYEGTTVRMIADKAGVSAGQVTFYFGSKENLYREIMQCIFEQTGREFDPVCRKVYALREQGKLDRATAMEYLQMVIDVQIDFAANPENYDMMLIFSERWDGPGGRSDINAAITGKVERLTAELLIAASEGRMNVLKARVISRAVNGAIVSFGEHPGFLLAEVRDSDEVDFLKLYLRNFIQNAIDAAIKAML